MGAVGVSEPRWSGESESEARRRDRDLLVIRADDVEGGAWRGVAALWR